MLDYSVANRDSPRIGTPYGRCRDFALLVGEVDDAGVRRAVVGVERGTVRPGAVKRLDGDVLEQSFENALDRPLGDVDVLGERVDGDAAEAEGNGEAEAERRSGVTQIGAQLPDVTTGVRDAELLADQPLDKSWRPSL